MLVLQAVIGSRAFKDAAKSVDCASISFKAGKTNEGALSERFLTPANFGRSRRTSGRAYKRLPHHTQGRAWKAMFCRFPQKRIAEVLQPCDVQSLAGAS